MMIGVSLLLLLIACFCISQAYFGDPTPDEIKRGFEVVPLKSWGHQARVQHSMRILSIGGSNTANCFHCIGPPSYPDILEGGLANGGIVDEPYFRNKSYVLNNGFSGFGIDFFTGRKYEFEQWNVSRWPNIIIVDCSVNGVENVNAEAEMRKLESLVHSFAWKYRVRNLSSPDIMFYNMPHLSTLYQSPPDLKTIEERREYAKSYHLLPGIFKLDDAIRQFAAHYHFPVINWGNATYEAGLRHWINASSLLDPPWLYSRDGIHMSRPYGCQFGMNHLLAPFFKSVMAPRESIEDEKLEDYSVATNRLLPPQPVLMNALSYFAGEGFHNMHELKEAIVESEDKTQWSTRDLDHFDYCYGSKEANTVGEVRFLVPSDCSIMLGCRLQLSFIHSWNSEYIGNASCTLHRHLSKGHAGTHIDTLFIYGQERTEKATIPVKSEFAVNVTEGLHSVKCVNLVQDRLTCMLGIHVNNVMFV